jgi:hypothetical protein
MLRRAVTLTAVISLTAWLGCAGLWARSMFVGDYISYGKESVFGFNSAKGQVVIIYVRVRDDIVARYLPKPVWENSRGAPRRVPGISPKLNRFGFIYWNTFDPKQTNFEHAVGVGAPIWFVMLPLAILPAVDARRIVRNHRREKRLRLGLCLRCGYDLRASFGRCPECGASVAT